MTTWCPCLPSPTQIHDSMRPSSVTMSFWFHGTPWFHRVPQILGPCSVTMDPWFHEVSQCSNALLGSTVSHSSLLVPRGTMVSNVFPSFHESLRSSTGPLVPWGPAVSQWPHQSTRSCSVTMLCMVPQGPSMSQWPLWCNEDPECHNGLLASM